MRKLSILKPSSLIFPVSALAIAGVWLVTQHRSIYSLEQASNFLENAIASQSTYNIAGSQPEKLSYIAQAAKDKGPLDWKKVSARFSEICGSRAKGHTLEMMTLEERLMAMSHEEVIAAFDEIAALDLTKKLRTGLEDLLIFGLFEKAPEIVMTKINGRLRDGDESLSWQFSIVMYDWAAKDPTAAFKWFDQQIGAGAFDSKSLNGINGDRLNFEKLLITSLLPTDPDATARHLAALPEDQRCRALPLFSEKIDGTNEAALVKLIRDQLPEKQQGEALATRVSCIVKESGGYSEVAEFLNLIQATPAERTVCVERAAESELQEIYRDKKITREDLDMMREWVTSQAPDSTDIVTGKALANASRNGGKIEFSEAAKLILEYHTAAGNDEILTSFLCGQSASQNREQARILAQNISDPISRGEILKKFK